VVTYYLISDLISRSLLIGFRSIEKPYTGENLTTYVVAVLVDFELGNYVSYFVSNNNSTNNVAIKAIYRNLKLKNAKRRKLRYLNYIINLLIKAFLFKTEEGSLDFEIIKIAKIKSEVR
jgi:hypothetical protein